VVSVAFHTPEPAGRNGTGSSFICCVPILKLAPLAGASPVAPETVTSMVTRSEYWRDNGPTVSVELFAGFETVCDRDGDVLASDVPEPP